MDSHTGRIKFDYNAHRKYLYDFFTNLVLSEIKS